MYEIVTAIFVHSSVRVHDEYLKTHYFDHNHRVSVAIFNLDTHFVQRLRFVCALHDGQILREYDSGEQCHNSVVKVFGIV